MKLMEFICFWRSAELADGQRRFHAAVKKHDTSIEAVRKEAEEAGNGSKEHLGKVNGTMKKIQSGVEDAISQNDFEE